MLPVFTSIRPTLVRLLDPSLIVNPAHSTSPRVYPSEGGWVGNVTDRRAIKYGSLRGSAKSTSLNMKQIIMDQLGRL